MGSFLQLANDDVIVAYKRVPIFGNDYGDGSDVLEDWGDLMLEMYDYSTRGLISTEVLLTASSFSGTLGNRPHVSRWRNWLIICWDIADGNESATSPDFPVTKHRSFLRIYMIEGA